MMAARFASHIIIAYFNKHDYTVIHKTVVSIPVKTIHNTPVELLLTAFKHY